jgi:hypothetical protein
LTAAAGDTDRHRSGRAERKDQQSKIRLTDVSTVSGDCQPDDFGAWQSVWERHRRWSDDGTYVRIFAAVRAAAPERDEQLRNLLSVDSTIARAHQHSAGARHGAHTGGTVE